MTFTINATGTEVVLSETAGEGADLVDFLSMLPENECRYGGRTPSSFWNDAYVQCMISHTMHLRIDRSTRLCFLIGKEHQLAEMAMSLQGSRFCICEAEDDVCIDEGILQADIAWDSSGDALHRL